jgi:hypothetical protein
MGFAFRIGAHEKAKVGIAEREKPGTMFSLSCHNVGIP